MSFAPAVISYGTTVSVCFIAGTLVKAENGDKSIEDICIGDKVYAYNDETGEIALKSVVNTFVNEATELVHVFVNNEEIICTNEHPFYSPVKGWTEACQLRAGDILVSLNGEYVIVEKVQHEILESPVKVYNFEVDDFHTNYVGNGDGVLVHNSCNANNYRSKALEYYGSDGQGVQDHHVFPQAIERHTGYFSNAGINIHSSSNIELIDPAIHSKMSSPYNSLWTEFIDENPDASWSAIHHAVGYLDYLAKGGVLQW